MSSVHEQGSEEERRSLASETSNIEPAELRAVLADRNQNHSKDEEEIEADINDFIPTPPDGGWGWVIVLSSFMNHFILDGISYAFGSFLPYYQEFFGSSVSETSALMSCLVGCYMLSAPVASALINKFGCRPVGIAGSVIAAFAFIICTLSTSIGMMIFTFGVLGGIGFGLMYMPAVLSVSLYFEEKRSIAVGIGMCGTGVGTLTFGPLGSLLLTHMDWKGAHYILAGIILNGVVFAALIRPLLSKHDMDQLKEKAAKKKAAKNGTALKPIAAPTPKQIRTERPFPQSPAPGSRMATSHTNVRSSHSSHLTVYRSMSRLGSQQVVHAKLTQDEAEDLKRPMYRKDIFYSGSVYHLPEFQQNQSNVKEFVASITSIPAMHEDKPRSFKCSLFPRQMGDILAEMLDFSLLKDLRFDIIAILSMFIMLGYLVPFAFLSARAQELHIEVNQASFLIFILGLSTMIGRPLASAVAQIPRVKALYVHNIVLLLAGVACAIVPLCMSFPAMGAAAFCYGMFMGGHVSLSPIVLVDFLGLSKLTTAYGLLTLVRGIATLAGPPMAGKVHDHFQSYDNAFYIAGALIILSALGFCMLEMQCIKPKEPTKKPAA